MNKLCLLIMLIHMNTMFGMSKLATPSKQILALEVLHAAIRNFSTAAKKDQLLFKSTPQLWASFFDKAIRRRILNKNFNREECEDYQWIVKDKTGAIWDSYDKPEVIKFIREKLYDRPKSKHIKKLHLYEKKEQSGKVYVQDRTLSGEKSNECRLDHVNDFFFYSSDMGGMDFFELRHAEHFDMQVFINNERKDEIERIKHRDLKIPYSLELQGCIKGTSSYGGSIIGGWRPALNLKPLEWTSLSDNGQNIITKLHDGGYYLWSIEHLSNKLTLEQLEELSNYKFKYGRSVALDMLKQMENKN